MNSTSSTNSTPAFRGKTIVVFLRACPPEHPVILSDCVMEECLGRTFLVGTSEPVRAGTKNWPDGVRRGVAWEAVEQYLLFDSVADYHSRLSTAATPFNPFTSGIPMMPGMPILEFPQDESGFPREPSGIPLESETPLEVGDTVLSYSQGRWWRAEVVDIPGDDMVTIHYPGWDSKWDVTVPKTELQVDLGSSLESD